MKFLLLLPVLLWPSFADAENIKVLSYNVWFDDASGSAFRYQQINALISRENADYVCLQEVTPTYLQMLEKAFAAQYHLYDDHIANKRYGNVVLTKAADARSRILRLETHMNRDALIVYDQDYAVVNIHLESLLTDTRIRERQIAQINHQVLHFPKVILCGDVNFGDGERENARLSAFVDPGQDLAEVTYDVENNPFAQRTAFYGEPSRRLDRILIKSDPPVINVRFEVKKVDFSDHYPIVLLFDDRR